MILNGIGKEAVSIVSGYIHRPVYPDRCWKFRYYEKIYFPTPSSELGTFRAYLKRAISDTSYDLLVTVNLSLSAPRKYWRSGGRDPLILKVRTKWRWVVSFTATPSTGVRRRRVSLTARLEDLWLRKIPCFRQLSNHDSWEVNPKPWSLY
jgi:hypothetical protein